MDKNLGIASDITHAATGIREVGSTVGSELAKGSEALQTVLKKAAVVVGDGIQSRRDEVIAYTRREPGAALMTAAGLGFIVGLALAMGSSAGTRRKGMWHSVLGRRTRPGWRTFLRLE
jgi:hypothetical protein